jgi:hypothetical protein
LRPAGVGKQVATAAITPTVNEDIACSATAAIAVPSHEQPRAVQGRRMFDLAELRKFEAQFEDRLNAREPEQAKKA